MGYKQHMTDKQRLDWFGMQYKAMLDARRGHNYQYYSDDLGKKLFKSGYNIYDFQIEEGRKYSERFATSSEIEALEIVEKLRKNGNYARIIVGYSKNVQRIKMFSIIYKTKT